MKGIEHREVIVRVAQTDHNYSALVEGLYGVVCSANTMDQLKVEVEDAIEYYLEGLREEGYPIPLAFQGDYSLTYKEDAGHLLDFHDYFEE